MVVGYVSVNDYTREGSDGHALAVLVHCCLWLTPNIHYANIVVQHCCTLHQSHQI